MEPIPTQTAYADSDAVSRNLKPLIIKSSVALAVLVVILGAAAYFVWPMPQMRFAESLTEVKSLFDSNDLDGALAKTDELLAKDPNNDNLLVTKALTLAQKGSLGFKEEEYGGQAVVVAQQAVAVNPQSSEAYRALAYAYEIQEQYAAAHTNYAKAIELDPTNVRAIFGNAHSYDLEGDMAKAEDGYRLALSLDRSFDQVYLGLARVMIYRENTEEAMSYVQTLIQRTTNARLKAEASYMLAYNFLAKNDVDAALRYADQAITADPTYALGWFVKGSAQYKDSLDKTKYSDPAVRDALMKESYANLETALALNPKQSIVYLQKGTQLTTTAHFAKARESYQKGLDAVDSDITLSATSKVEMKQRFELAIRLLEQVRARVITSNDPAN